MFVLRGKSGEYEVLVIQRRGLEIFALPKGKMEEGETKVETAKREFAEETGYEIPDDLNILQDETISTNYVTARGKRKTVTFFPVYLPDDTVLPVAKIQREAETTFVDFVSLSWLSDEKNEDRCKSWDVFRRFAERSS